MTERYDIVVVGAGIGGLCAAARALRAGFRVLVLEKLAIIGGRFSSLRHKHLVLNTGGNVIAVHGHVTKTFHDLSVPIVDLVVPEPGVSYRIHGENVAVRGKGGLRHVLSKTGASAAEITALMGAIKEAFEAGVPRSDMSFEHWLLRYSRNPIVHGVFRALAGSLLSVNLDEVPAHYLLGVMKDSPQYPYGLPVGGAINLCRTLAAYIKANGGTLVTRAIVETIEVAGRQVTAVVYRRGGVRFRVETDVVFSNATPRQTVAMVGEHVVGTDYVNHIDATIRPAPAVEAIVLSKEPLFEGGILCLTESRRLAQIVHVNHGIKGMAPGDDALYSSYAPFSRSFEPVHIPSDVKDLVDDWKDNFPGYEKRWRFVALKRFTGEYPGLRTVPGMTLDVRTPVSGLYLVGEVSGPFGLAGTEAAARSAELAVQDLLENR